jgi:hypothetical protein
MLLHRCHRLGSDFALNGDITKPQWATAEQVALRLYDGASPRYATAVKSLWSERRVYFAFQCEDPEPTGTMTRRDDPLFEDGNVVEVLIDPLGQGKSYFEFEVNPLGTLMDLFFDRLDRDWHDAVKWNARGAECAVRIQREHDVSLGWTTELSIPFDDLQLAKRPTIGSAWRLNYYRYNTVSTLPGNHLELCAWSPTAIPKFDQPERFGAFQFVE